MTKHRAYSWVSLAMAMLAAPEAREEPNDRRGLDDLKHSHRGAMSSSGAGFYF